MILLETIKKGLLAVAIMKKKALEIDIREDVDNPKSMVSIEL